MPDLLIKDIDSETADRIKRIARERGWPINDVVINLLREALGLSKPEPPLPGDIARLTGTWEDEESKALNEAIEALRKLG
jgi:GMP synthase-like glutamine amidotransferase